ncbi:hypothetical protein D1007_10669 [Hordeum vulgare]|nr:hypothetical protein D1007_10669 [Hordeum vulgare]
MMETGSDDTAPAPTLFVHSGYTMAQAHYNAAMAKGQPVSARTSALEWALEQYRLALGQVDGERASQDVLAGRVAMNFGFIAEKHAINDVIRAQAAARQEAFATKV